MHYAALTFSLITSTLRNLIVTRRSTPNQTNLGQPPPAHQNTSSRVLNMPMSPFELKFHTGAASSAAVAAAAAKGNLHGPTLIPGTSSTLTPIDLSSG